MNDPLLKTPSTDQARAPQGEPAPEERLDQALDEIHADARRRAESYPGESLVPEGGE